MANAVKYGGAAPRVRGPAFAPNRPAGHDDVLFVVEDEGLGIAAEERKHIFEPFYRGREAVARQIQGTGLGLSLVWRIAEAHGGSVTVKSEPGRGSAFTLRLPAGRVGRRRTGHRPRPLGHGPLTWRRPGSCSSRTSPACSSR